MQVISILVLAGICCSIVGVVRGDEVKNLKTLKRAYPNFRVGVALGGHVLKKYSGVERALIQAQFNAVTPENCMKPGPIQPAEGEWKFEEADALVKFAGENGMEVYGHTLAWHFQTGDWFFKDGEKKASREVALARLKKHIETVVGRYKGKIRGWDVVNEAISDKKEEYLRPTPWLEIVGEDYIEQAFRFAAAADPGAELQYNDYGIEMPVKRKKTIRLIKSLQAKGVKVDSVGIQGHWQLDKVPFKEIEEAIVAFRKLGVRVAITELDLDVLPRKVEGADVSAAEKESKELQEVKGCPPEVLKRQAEQYGRLFSLFKKYEKDLVRVTFWGLNDGRTWLSGWPIKRYNHPLLFDRDSKPKAAFEAVMEAGK
jgi:endo-1,4-beta-xylanase